MKKILFSFVLLGLHAGSSFAENQIEKTSELAKPAQDAKPIQNATKNGKNKVKNSKQVNNKKQNVRTELEDVDQRTLDQEVSSGDTVTESIIKEKGKWIYLKNELGKNIEGFTTVLNKIGDWQEKLAVVPAVLSVPVPFCCLAFGTVGQMERFLEIIHWDDLMRLLHLDHVDERVQQMVLIGILTAALPNTVYITNRLIGRWLKGTNSRCQKALNLFAMNWENHKNNVPTSLHGLFEALREDDAFLSLTPAQAQNLVESFISIGLAVEMKC